MSKWINIKLPKFKELWLNVDLIESLSLIDVVDEISGESKSLCVVQLPSGAIWKLAAEDYARILKRMRQKDENDLDIPEAFLKGWNGKDGDSSILA